jgi:type II secretory pathway component GspD/PulD (secretin)
MARSESGTSKIGRPLFSNRTNVIDQGPPCYFAIDERTRSLIVRGTEKDLQAVAEFVAILDLPPNKPLPQLKNLHAFKLRFASPENVCEVLRTLSIDVFVGKIPKSTVLLVHGPEAAVKEATEIIEALDAEVIKPPAPGTGEIPKDPKGI